MIASTRVVGRRLIGIFLGMACASVVLAQVESIPAKPKILYHQTFDDGELDGVHALNGARLIQRRGQFAIDIGSPGQGVSFDVPDPNIQCFEIAWTSIAPVAPLQRGDALTWRFIVTDVDTGVEYPILESDWTKVGSTQFSTRKKNKRGETVIVEEPDVQPEDLDFLPPRGQEARLKWDRRTLPDGTEQVQLEIVLIDPDTGRVTKYVKIFPWRDPPSFIFTRVELTSTFEAEISFTSVMGADVHIPVVFDDDGRIDHQAIER